MSESRIAGLDGGVRSEESPNEIFNFLENNLKTIMAKESIENSEKYCFLCNAPAVNKCQYCDDEVYYCSEKHYNKFHRSKFEGEYQCNPFSIKYSKEVGRYMVANRDIHPGDIIFHDQAAVVGPDPGSLPMCLECHALIQEDEHYRCSICEFPLCSKDCEKGPEHKKVCPYLKGKGRIVTNFKEPNSIYDVIMPLKLVIMKKDDPEMFKMIDKFLDHKDQRLAYPDYWKNVKENVVDLIMDLDVGISVTEDDIFRIVGLIDTNSREIGNRNGACFKGFFNIGSILSHRCVFNQREIIAKKYPFSSRSRCTVFIPKGQEIFTTYIWPHLNTRERRKTLQDGWHFSCECFRCSDPTELGALTSAISCTFCRDGYFLNENPLSSEDVEQVWKCQLCHKIGNSNDLQIQLTDLTNEVEAIGRSDLEKNLICLSKCRKIVHCNHYLMTELRHRIIPIICRKANSSHSDFPDEKIVLKRQLCEENLAVQNIITPGLTTQRGGILFELSECDFTLAMRRLEQGKISSNEFVEQLQNIKLILLECTQCLSNEKDGSIDQYYERSAMVRLKDILDYLIHLENS